MWFVVSVFCGVVLVLLSGLAIIMLVALRFSDKTSLKQNLLIASLDMIHSNKGITEALIRLCGYPGWYVPLLFANTEDAFSGFKSQL